MGAIGISFFLALLLASSGRIDLVLECWVIAFAVLVAVLSTIYGVRSHITPVSGLVALLAASVTVDPHLVRAVQTGARPHPSATNPPQKVTTPMSTTVAITGADGFIGSHLAETLVGSGYQVRAMVQYNSFGSWGWLEVARQRDAGLDRSGARRCP